MLGAKFAVRAVLLYLSGWAERLAAVSEGIQQKPRLTHRAVCKVRARLAAWSTVAALVDTSPQERAVRRTAVFRHDATGRSSMEDVCWVCAQLTRVYRSAGETASETSSAHEGCFGKTRLGAGGPGFAAACRFNEEHSTDASFADFHLSGSALEAVGQTPDELLLCWLIDEACYLSAGVRAFCQGFVVVRSKREREIEHHEAGLAVDLAVQVVGQALLASWMLARPAHTIGVRTVAFEGEAQVLAVARQTLEN